MRRGPNIGETIMVEPVYVSKSNRVLGTNPTNYGNYVFIKNDDELKDILPNDILSAITNGRSPFRIRCFDESLPAEVVSKQSGNIIVAMIPQKSNKEKETKSSTFESPKREESIEWEGTPQEIDPEKTKNRERVFYGEDRRGSKNDLL